jgi:hypothetical protein
MNFFVIFQDVVLKTYVVFRYHIVGHREVPDDKPYCVTPTLERARNALPADLVRVPRYAIEDPSVVETWL